MQLQDLPLAMHDPAKPYNDLPLLPPAADIETKAVLKRCVTARAALAELRLAGHLIPDQTVLINSIPVLEAKDSSEIENIVTTNDALFREASRMGDEASDAAAKEALRYRTALYQGFQTLEQRPISTRTVIDICRTINAVALDVRKTSGTTLKNSYTGEVIYTPPEGENRLREMLANWEKYLNSEIDIDPIIRMAVLHYQFEAIHPFIDGNGRTGRIINILSLIQYGLLDRPTLYLSRHILRTRGEYYRRLAAVTANGDWEAWILYMLEAVEVTAGWTNQKIRAIRALMDATAAHIQDSAPRIYTRDLVDLIFTQPYCRIANLVERRLAERHTASAYLKTLVDIGVLEKERLWRDKLFLNRKYLELLGSDGNAFEPYRASQPKALGAMTKRKGRR